jgi:hypothetical protein
MPGLRGVPAFIAGVLLWSSVSACAVRKAAGAPLAPIERAWEVPTLELYSEWWRKTEACSGRTGDMSQVTFYAVDAPSGAIGLNGTVAHGWWVRQGNRIYLPAHALGEEWLVAPRDAPRPAPARVAPQQEVRRGLPPRLDRGLARFHNARRPRQSAGPLKADGPAERHRALTLLESRRTGRVEHRIGEQTEGAAFDESGGGADESDPACRRPRIVHRKSPRDDDDQAQAVSRRGSRPAEHACALTI